MDALFFHRHRCRNSSSSSNVTANIAPAKQRAGGPNTHRYWFLFFVRLLVFASQPPPKNASAAKTFSWQTKPSKVSFSNSFPKAPRKGPSKLLRIAEKGVLRRAAENCWEWLCWEKLLRMAVPRRAAEDCWEELLKAAAENGCGSRLL